ncbi:Panacea domain-containing protein [Methylobacterium sp. J-068]|uniref:Panacea domain-containing protein n=1 Tax=Methylobacterium sp. J-068 TaxID=2836649 RepID=UPI001FB8AD89|nr:Panacea domain-containing protein [Methylobacterium sp. J-068]MCJ2033150.1 SocA family protein [Methylobacterium sp. J-068]
MPNYSSKAVANEFLRRRSAFGLPAQMWLQKLVYIAHGWNLAVNNEPLVADSAEAWDGGPVYRPIWNHIRDYGFGKRSELLEEPWSDEPFKANFTEEENKIVNLVWDKYKDYSGHQLSQMTHLPGTPWTETYIKKGRDTPIDNALIRRHYLDLAKAGRAA